MKEKIIKLTITEDVALPGTKVILEKGDVIEIIPKNENRTRNPGNRMDKISRERRARINKERIEKRLKR